MSDHDHEQLRALETERAFLAENGKHDRARQVDEQLAAVRARLATAQAAAGVQTTQAEAPPETTSPSAKPRARTRKSAK